ncbi:Acyl-coenzyme A thioesterase 13 [Tolypocladium capitatum]|uniref:Acyl-coenzyme A thioesterase 13 n=1 Tax=Tolypocladium capitatum TaxID=45235 RepID=A0A2K3QQH7_9HYPO|nr:Acyl-coenzyme A thioesterase 13 [Tolypocladium capitatum]
MDVEITEPPRGDRPRRQLRAQRREPRIHHGLSTGPDQTESADVVAARTAHVQSLLERLLANSPIYGLMLSTISLVSVTRGAVTTSLALTPAHVNSKGGLHGAVSAVIVDFTTGLAIASRDLRDTTGASVDMHLSYLSSARIGDEVRIETRAERVGGSLAFVTVRIARVDGDGRETVVTLAQHTKYVRGTAPA